jgi:hypothetical protein
MPAQSFAGNVLAGFPPTAHTAVASTASRTNLWVPALWTPIPALDPYAGKVYKLSCGGVISTTATPTIQFTATFGQSATPASNLSLGTTTTIPLGTLTSRNWYAEFTLGFRSVGIAASGATCTGNGFVTIDNGAGVVGICNPMGSSVPTTADHTTAQGLVLDVLWSASSASNTITCAWTLLQSLN